jgi:beta-galactosidase
MWSIGNEVLEQWSDAAADTLSLEEANLILNFGHGSEQLANEGEMSVNSLLTKKLADMTRSLDATRPITAGCNEPAPGNHLFRSGALDIIGYNYHDEWFKDVAKNFPGKPFIVTESVSALMTRGYYVMPSDSLIICPDRWDVPYYNPSFSCSAYDNCRTPWGNTHEGSMLNVKRNAFVSGQFVWTGFDYIGEPTPYGWPARSSYFGIVDLAGFPKDVYYMYQSEWRPDKNVLHLFPHWNWQDGQAVDLWAYYNNADEVELFVNGVSQGVKSKGEDDLHVSWRVTYQPGEVKAVSRKDGKIVAEQTIRTAGEPTSVRLTADRSEIKVDGYDLSYITVEIVDKDGNLCPWAENNVKFEVSGAGTNVGVDNGCQTSLERFKADNRNAFYGKALLIVQSNENAGEIRVRACSEGLNADTITIKTVE